MRPFQPDAGTQQAAAASDDLRTARDAFEGRAWGTAREAFRRADGSGTLEPDDLRRFAMSEFLTGDDRAFVLTLDRAHRAFLEAEDLVGGARCAFWIGLHLADIGDIGPATGWLGRAARLLERAGGDHVEAAYLLIPAAHQRLATGDHDGAFESAATALESGERFGEPDLIGLALLLQGHARVGQGRVDEGLALLDEAMVAVATGQTTPLVTGLLYCGVIGACRRVFDLGRAHDWTAALRSWCSDQPDLVPYRGECLVFHSEILQLHGAWDEALGEARRACELAPGDDSRPAAGAALYQQGEVHRLRGELAAAEEAYRAATRAGREPQPGLALLRLAQDDVEAAAAALHRLLSETGDPLRRVRLLPAVVETALASRDLDEARRATEELEGIADRYDAPALRARAGTARGALALACDDPLEALTTLRRALDGWLALDAPYDAARTRVLLSRACSDLGDDDTAALELDAAHAGFEALGAAPDLARIDALRGRGRRSAGAHGLTPRELEVLALVATGRTNRAIADELFISQKTVARHVSSILGKLGLPSRSAATAYAYEHELL